MNHVKLAKTRHVASDLQKSILATLAYFDLFDYPMKEDEIWKYLFVETRLIASLAVDEVKRSLDELVKLGHVNQKDDFYFLPGRQKIVETRKQRYQISLKKIKKARHLVWWLRFIPWIKAIFIGSSLGFFNAQEKSDIDLFVITSRGGLWSARFWSVGFLKIFGLRPISNEHHKNKFCLSYFITEDNLNLWPTRFDRWLLRPAKCGAGSRLEVPSHCGSMLEHGANHDCNGQAIVDDFDIHLIYLLSYYLPLYAEDNLWQEFIAANNWLKEYLPNFYYDKRAEGFSIKPRLVWLKKIIHQTQFGWEEKLVKKIQLKIMPKILKEMANRDSRVIINDKMIKLHSNDKRLWYYGCWIRKCEEVIK